MPEFPPFGTNDTTKNGKEENRHHLVAGVPDGTQIVKTLSEMMSQPTYIASCSFGKDSIATILLALEHDEPLDRVVFSEVMFDHARGISGEIPEHIGWIYDTAIPKLHNIGVHVDVVRAERDYCYFFRKCRRGGASRREDLRFPARRQMLHQSGLQSRAHTKIPRRNCWRSPACQNEYRAVHRYRLRRTATTCQTHGEPNVALGEIRLHRADGETTLRHSRATVADLHDRDARRMLVLPELQNTAFRQSATQPSRTMGGVSRVEPYAELVQLRIQIRPYRAGGRKTDGRARTTINPILIMTRHVESHMQRMCVHWFRLQYPTVGKLLFAVPNGGARLRSEAAIMRSILIAALDSCIPCRRPCGTA